MSASRSRQGPRCASRMLRAASFIAPGFRRKAMNTSQFRRARRPSLSLRLRLPPSAGRHRQRLKARSGAGLMSSTDRSSSYSLRVASKRPSRLKGPPAQGEQLARGRGKVFQQGTQRVIVHKVRIVHGQKTRSPTSRRAAISSSSSRQRTGVGRSRSRSKPRDRASWARSWVPFQRWPRSGLGRAILRAGSPGRWQGALSCPCHGDPEQNCRRAIGFRGTELGQNLAPGTVQIPVHRAKGPVRRRDLASVPPHAESGGSP